MRSEKSEALLSLVGMPPIDWQPKYRDRRQQDAHEHHQMGSKPWHLGCNFPPL